MRVTSTKRKALKLYGNRRSRRYEPQFHCGASHRTVLAYYCHAIAACRNCLVPSLGYSSFKSSQVKYCNCNCNLIAATSYNRVEQPSCTSSKEKGGSRSRGSRERASSTASARGARSVRFSLSRFRFRFCFLLFAKASPPIYRPTTKKISGEQQPWPCRTPPR